MKTIISTITYIIAFIAALVFTSCEDHFPEINPEIGPGIALMKADFSFQPLEPALESRTAGDATKSIESMYMFVYKEDKTLFKDDRLLPEGYLELDVRVSNTNNNRPSNEADSVSAETNTPQGSFEVNIPYGRYYIYLVANTDISGWTEEDNYGSIGALLHNKLTWEGIKGSNPHGLPNKQMIGSLSANNNVVTFDDQNLLMAETVTIDRGLVQLKGWLKRAVSKVTIAFDTSELRDNTWIYIRSARIVDIPAECYLGESNIPGADGRDISDELIDRSEVIYYGNAKENQLWENGAAEYKHWMELSNVDVVSGYWSDRFPADIKDDMTVNQRLALEHGENAEALYFLENNQGTGKDKRQDADGDFTIDKPHGGQGPDKDGWKDNKKYGTYIEVEAYYKCEDVLRLGQGKIKYRFMLGKDIYKDYNAERNHHYKLTLKFKGFANDIDWHIEYVEEAKPGFHVPETTFVPYSYNMETTMSVRATPMSGYKLKNIEAIIIENQWRPYTDDLSWTKPAYNEYAWNMQRNQQGNYAGFDQYRKNNGIDKDVAPGSEFGFLSLRRITKDIYDLGGMDSPRDTKKMVENFRRIYFTVDKAHDQKMLGAKYRRTYDQVPQSETSTQGETTTNETDDGNYTYYMKVDNDGNKNYTLVLPLCTRAKTLDSWAVYSGANPYMGARRMAKVKFIATFVSETDPSDTYQKTGSTTVYQDFQLANPRAIFRAHDNLQPFHVTLLNTVPEFDETLKNKNNTVSNGVITRHAGIVDNTYYETLISQGTWTAEILHDPHGLVMLRKGNQVAIGEGATINGLTGSKIDFTYTPRHTVAPGDAQGAIIQVRYHNNTCMHNILVRQGYGNVKFPGSSLEWSTFNVYQKGELCKSPLSIGSLYRRHTNLNFGIAEENASRYSLRCLVRSTETYKVKDGTAAGQELTWDNIKHTSYSTSGSTTNAFNTFKIAGVSYAIPKYSKVSGEWMTKETNDENQKVHMVFGVCYADGATATLNTSDAFGYVNYDNSSDKSKLWSPKGSRGCFAYSNDGSILFFPFGEHGHGHRKQIRWTGGNSSSNSYGYMAYGSVDVKVGGTPGETDSQGAANMGATATGVNQYRPMAYDLPGQKGAMYWINDDEAASWSDAQVALDFNWGNLMTNFIKYDNVGREKEPDALPIKPVVSSSQ